MRLGVTIEGRDQRAFGVLDLLPAHCVFGNIYHGIYTKQVITATFFVRPLSY